MAAAAHINSDSKKRYNDNPYQIPNHKITQSLGSDKSKNLLLSLNTTSATKQTNGLKKQDSLLSLMSPTSNQDNYDESPQSHEKQLLQIEKQKAENKNRMIEDFKSFIMKQQQHKNNNSIDIFSNNVPSNNQSYSNQMYGLNSYSKLKSQTSFRVNDTEQSNKTLQFKDDSTIQSKDNTENAPIKRKLNRQNTITQAINKKLKIVHKTRDQLFNEKLQLFKGVSTYIETRSYLQNLNLLNKKNLIEGMKKNQQWNEEFDQIKQRQDFIDKNRLYEDDENECSSFEEEEEEIGKGEDKTKDKYNADNPYFEKNVNHLLDKAHKHLKEVRTNRNVRQNKSMNDLDKEKKFFQHLCENMLVNDPFAMLDNTDENQFYDQLKTVLQDNKTLAQQKQEEKEVQEVFINQQQKKYEIELLNQIYQNPTLAEKLTQEQIQQFINQQVKEKFHPDAIAKEKQTIKDKVLGGLNVDIKNTNLDAKNHYQEYVEKANHIRKTLNRLNEHMFKQKWANALMKRKQEKEKMRNSIIRKIQNNEIQYNRIDVLFPSKRKMQHIKSKINTNLEFSQGSYIVRSNSIEESPKQTVQDFFPTQMEVLNTQSITNHQSHRSSNDIYSNTTLTVHDTKVGFSARNDITTIPNSLRHIDIKDPSQQKVSTYLYQTPSGYVRQVTRVGLTEEELNKKQEIFEKQQIKKQQEQLKKDIIQNMTYYTAKKSSAPCLSSQELPKIKSASHINSPTLSSASQGKHLLKQSYSLYRKENDYTKNNNSQSSQFLMRSTSKASSLVGTPSYKEIDPQSKLKSIGNNLSKVVTSNKNFQFNKMASFHSSIISPAKSPEKFFKSPDKLTKSQVYPFSAQNLDPNYDVSAQKNQLYTLLTNLESEKKIRRKDNKEIDKQITQIQNNCSQDLNKIKGNEIGFVKDILDIDFLKFSMKKNQHIRDTNIKNFLNAND